MSSTTPSFLLPIALDSFFSTYWEKQPLHIARSSAAPLLDVSDLESLLSTQTVYFPGVQLTQSGKAIDVSTYTDAQNAILPLRLFEQHAQGATIVLSQAQKLIASLRELCREVTRTLSMRSQTNVYLSPPGNQGFNAHYDTHDVFILQVSGAKTFNFYPSSVELPCHDEQFDPETLDKGSIDTSIELSAGDTLYIPRGIVHDAVAHDSASSLHVTLGVFPVLMRDMLNECIQLLAQTDSNFRRSIDASLHAASGSSVENLQRALLPLVQRLQTDIEQGKNVARVHSRIKDELALSSQQDCNGFSRRNPAQRFNEESLLAFVEIRLRKQSVLSYECTVNGVKIRTFGQLLEFGESMSAVVKKLLLSGRLLKEDLQALDTDQQTVLVNRLLQENLVDLME